jgi:hypothetical protein
MPLTGRFASVALHYTEFDGPGRAKLVSDRAVQIDLPVATDE